MGHHGELAVGMRHSIVHKNLIVEEGVSQEPFPLLKQAWVYQERLLSPRFLHFTPQELMFECGEGSSCECSDAVDWDSPLTFVSPKIRHVQALAGLSRTSLPQSWCELRAIFTARFVLPIRSFTCAVWPCETNCEVSERGIPCWVMGVFNY